MLDFRNHPRPPNYLSPRYQWRLLILVLLFGGVVWLALEARNPDHYRWLWQIGQKPSVVEEDLDTRLPPGVPHDLDTFVIPAPDAASPSHPARRGPLSADQLATIRDDEPFRQSEHAAWFQLLDILQSTDEATLAGQSSGPATFIQLFRQPEEYRGDLVTIRGILRGSEKVEAPKNDFQIAGYYQTWVFPDDNPSNPIVVYCLNVPKGFPSGMELAERVELVGFFFKRWPYAAKDTIRTAPVVLAKGFAWTPAPAGPAMAESLSLPRLIGTAAAIAAVVVLASWWRTRRVRPAKTDHHMLGTIDPPEAAKPVEAGFSLRLTTGEENEGER